MAKSFVLNTAKDYDLPVHIVQQVYDKNQADRAAFYEELENILNQRSK